MSTVRERGFSYVEVLLAMVLLVVLLVPAMQALQAGVANNQGEAVLTRELNLREKMETVLAKPFATLYAETYAPGGNSSTTVNALLSDTVGAADRRNVVLYRYDAASAALSSNDTGVLYIKVYYESDGSANALSTLTGKWW